MSEVRNTTYPTERRKSKFLPVFTAVFALISILAILCAVLGSTGGEEARFACTGLAGEGTRGVSEYAVEYFPKPEDAKVDDVYALARLSYRYEDGSTKVLILNSMGETVSPTGGEPSEVATFKKADFLFRFRYAYRQGWISTVQIPEGSMEIVAPILCMLVCIAVGYFLGGINTGLLLSKLVYRDNIRNYGSGNPGATNMLRVFGPVAAVLTLLGDLIKVIIALTFASFAFGAHPAFGFMGNGLLHLTGLAAIFGHVYPIYYGFKGGKGVTCAAALALYTCPVVAGILVLVFVGMVALTHYVSLSSITVCLLYPVVFNGILSFMGLHADPIAMLSSIIIGLFITFCHRKNIQRLLKGTENKMKFRKKDET